MALWILNLQYSLNRNFCTFRSCRCQSNHPVVDLAVAPVAAMDDTPLFVGDDVEYSHLLDELDTIPNSPVPEPSNESSNEPLVALESKVWDNLDEAQSDLMKAADASSDGTGKEDHQWARALVYSSSSSNDD